MRVFVLKGLLLALALFATAPAALAKPRPHTASKTPHAARSHATQSHATRPHSPTKAIRSSRSSKPVRAASARFRQSSRRSKKGTRAVPARRSAQAGPAPEHHEDPAPPQPEIHVTHDRKQHHAPTATRFQGRTASKSPRLELAAVEPGPLAPLAIISATTPRSPELQEESLASAVLSGMDGSLEDHGNPAPLRGSHQILLRQNQIAQMDGLARIQDDRDLQRMRLSHALVALPASPHLITDARLPDNRRFVRPWAAQFLSELARAHYVRFHSALQVNSAVRTVEFQQQLIHRNGNAAPADGDTASPHLTGQAVDLAKRGLSSIEIAWLRTYLLPLIEEGKIDVEEEFQQACFHISIYKRYAADQAHPEIATTHRGADAAFTLNLR